MKDSHLVRILASMLIILTMVSCLGNRRDNRLMHVQEIVSLLPDSALVVLDSIDPNTLTISDRHLYDFLTIKARDKAYVKHQSDSLILDILDYYSSYKSEGLYPEALYYAGRVYCDLGDRPTALRYFQQALDLLPVEGDSVRLDMRCTVLSQTSGLLTSLRLYDEAIPYLLEANKIEKQLNDTISIIQDLQLLGGTLLRAKRNDSAELVFNEALRYSVNVPRRHMAKSRMYLAAVKYQKGEIDSALCLIRDTYDQVHPLVRNNALCYGAMIYLKSGIFDTAQILASRLIESDYNLNKDVGYNVLLSQEIQPNVPLDVQRRYVDEYRSLIESSYDENSVQMAVDQQTLYNYQLHERDKLRAEQSKMDLWRLIFIIFLCILVLIIVVLYQKNRNKSNLIRLQSAIDNIMHLQMALETSHKIGINGGDEEKRRGKVDLEVVKNSDVGLSIQQNQKLFKRTVDDLRERLRDELTALSEKQPIPILSPEISGSDAYRQLQDRIRTDTPLNDDDSLWIELESAVTQASPNFRTHLQLLIGEPLSDIPLHTALLIKCQITPTQMASLACRSKNAIVSRRTLLGTKIFDEKIAPSVVDKIIRNL